MCLLPEQVSRLREKYEGIYLVRNERHVTIYNFSDGQAFEPDFILFLVDKNSNTTTYQLFIEPKGKHLREHDRRKQDFLKEITDRFRDRASELGASRNLNARFPRYGARRPRRYPDLREVRRKPAASSFSVVCRAFNLRDS